MSHEVPERSWQKVGVDIMKYKYIMTYKQKDYLITKDCNWEDVTISTFYIFRTELTHVLLIR